MAGFYSSKQWRWLREQALARHPFCVTPGCNRPSVVADHVIPRSQGGADSLDNLVGRCIPCHNARRGTGQPKAKGCDSTGMPVDATHWWSAAPCADENRSGLAGRDRAPPPNPVSSDPDLMPRKGGR